MLSEIYRVLSPTGVYICITYGLPEQRMDYFRKPDFYWNPIQHKIAKPTISTSAVVATEDKNEKNFHYIYVMRKQVDKDKQWDLNIFAYFKIILSEVLMFWCWRIQNKWTDSRLAGPGWGWRAQHLCTNLLHRFWILRLRRYQLLICKAWELICFHLVKQISWVCQEGTVRRKCKFH